MEETRGIDVRLGTFDPFDWGSPGSIAMVATVPVTTPAGEPQAGHEV